MEGLRLVIYLYDQLLFNETKEGVLHDAKVAIDLFNSLGFLINWEKSVVAPCKRIDFLGWIVDSKLLSFSLPVNRC